MIIYRRWAGEARLVRLWLLLRSEGWQAIELQTHEVCYTSAYRRLTVLMHKRRCWLRLAGEYHLSRVMSVTVQPTIAGGLLEGGVTAGNTLIVFEVLSRGRVERIGIPDYVPFRTSARPGYVRFQFHNATLTVLI